MRWRYWLGRASWPAVAVLCAVAVHPPAAAANWTGTYTIPLGGASVVVQEPDGSCSVGPAGGAITSTDIAANASRYQTALGSTAAAGSIPPAATVIGGMVSGTATLQGGPPGSYGIAVGAALTPPPWPDRPSGCAGDVNPGAWGSVSFPGPGTPEAFTADGAAIFALWGHGPTLYAGVRPASLWPASGAVVAVGPLQVRGEYAYTPGVPAVRALRSGAGTDVSVSWSTSGNGADVAYRLQREILGPAGAASGWTTVYRGMGTRWQSTDQSCGHGYLYRVQAYGSDGATPWATAGEWDAFPCSITVSAVGPSALEVSYPPVTPSAAYELLWCVSDGCTQVGEGVGTASQVRLTGLVPNTPYTVWACSVTDAWGCPVAAAWTPPEAPAGLGVSAAPGNPWNAALTWHAAGNPPGTAYVVERAAWNGGGATAPWAALGPAAPTLAATTSSQACGSEYAYAVYAVGGGGGRSGATRSGYFENAPCTLAVQALGATAVAASWIPSAPVAQEQGYSVLWQGGGAAGALPVGTATAATLTGLQPATAYTLRVAGNSGWQSAPTVVWTAAEPPLRVAIGGETPTSLTVSWSAGADPAGTAFEVYLEPGAGGAAVDLRRVAAPGVVEGDLACGASYVPFVRALGASGTPSAWASGPAAVTVPCAPVGLVVGSGGLGWRPAGGRGYLDLRWDPSPGASGYEVWVWDGARYEGFNVGPATAWDSRLARIFPPDAELYPNVAEGSLPPPLFSHAGGGLDLRDRPADLYCSAGSADCGGASPENYWLAVSAYDASGDSATFAPGGDPCASAAACVTPTLPLQTDGAAPQITAWTLGLGGAYASGASVPFTLDAVERPSGIAAYALSDDGSAWTVTAVPGCAVGGVAACSSTLRAAGSWTLPPGPGSKTVWARVESAAGVWSSPASATIYVTPDRTVPTVDAVLDGGAHLTATDGVTVDVRVTDSAAAAAALTWRARYSTDGGQSWSAWQPEGGATRWAQPWELPGGAAGPRTVLVQVENSDGNLGQGRATILYAPAPAPMAPPGPVAAGHGCWWPIGAQTVEALCVTTPQVQVALALPGGTVRMRVSLNDVTWGPWLPAAASLAVDLGAAPGPKSVWVQAEDASGTVTAEPAAYYVLDPGTPVVQAAWAGAAAATDASGHATLLLSCSDAAGPAALQVVVTAGGTTLYAGPCAAAIPLQLPGAGYQLVTATATNGAARSGSTELGIYVLGGTGTNG